MDFLLSFKRPFSSKSSKPIPIEISDFQLTTWVNFLLLQHKLWWKYFQLFAIITRYIVSTYMIVFETDYFKLPLVLFLDFIYFIDFFSALMYRIQWPKESFAPEKLSSSFSRLVWRNRHYKPRKIWMLIIDIISLTPLQLFKMWFKFNEAANLAANIIPILRIYRIFTFYVENIKNIFSSDIAVIALTLNFVALWIFCCHTFVCTFRWFAIHTYSEFIPSAKGAISFNDNSSIVWFLIHIYVNQFSMGNIGFGDITPATNNERLLEIFAIIMGFILLNGYLISDLTNTLAEKVREAATLGFRISLMKSELMNRRAPKEVVAKLEKFYQSLWLTRKGVSAKLKTTICLSNSLMSRINTDTFLPALNASILFRSCDEASKRAIAQIMEINLFMAGDAILKRNVMNSELLYVRKGTVEIMSYQDDETRVMTFGAGSVFGQIALLLSLPARSEVHAATFCEIHIIKRRCLFQVLKDYPEARAIIFNVHKNLLLNVYADTYKKESVTRKPENVLSTESFYKVPLEAFKISQNDICVVSVCPFVFEPNTIFLKIWNAMVTVVIVVILFYYPYCAVYKRKYPKQVEGLLVLVDVILIINIYLSFSTAFYKENVLFSSLRDIIASKFWLLSPYIDVIALLPLHYFIHDDSREKPFALCLRCLEFYKINFFFRKWGDSVGSKLAGCIRLVKYILYFFLFVYALGITFYLQACYNESCIPDSWYVNNPGAVESNSPLWVSIYISIVIITGTGYGDIVPKNIYDVVYAIFICLVGCFLFIYIISEFSANLSLKKEPQQNFRDLVYRMNLFLKKNNMLASVRLRVRQSLNLSWERNQGYEFIENRNVFYDTPVHLMSEINQFTKSRGFEKMILLKTVPKDVLTDILTESYRVLFPPHEVVIYAGEVCSSLGILDEGFCEVIYGRDSSLRKIIGPGTDISTLELLLGLTSQNNIRTLTHCTVIKVSKTHLTRCFESVPYLVEELQKCIDEFKNTEIFKELQNTQLLRLHLIVRPCVEKSLYHFRYSRAEGGRLEFKKPFRRLGLCQWISCLLGRATILPYGKFLKIWEVSRCVFAFISAILFPLLPFFELQVRSLTYFGYFLDISALIDLYFRAHVGYYNNNNLLVSHPLCTVGHYMKGGFILDFTACFPLDRIMFRNIPDPFGYKLVTHSSINYMRMLRILQIYRIATTVNYFSEDALSPPGLKIMLAVMLIYTLVYLSTLTSVLLLYCINYKENKAGDYKIIISDKYKQHFLSIQKNYNLSIAPFDMYVVNLYWITVTCLSLGFGDITAGSNKDLMVFVIIICTLSYFYFGYLTLVISSCLSSVDLNLTIYQKRMSCLIKFLKSENVEPLLREHIINHFEYAWVKHKGMKIRSVTGNFNLALKQDISLYFYEETIRKVGAFRHWDQPMSRLLCSHVDEMHFMSGAAIYKAGDIISELYIVHGGEVTLVGKNENETVTLGPSTVFGHVKNAPRGQPTLSAVATKNVVVLVIKTAKFYSMFGQLCQQTGDVKSNVFQEQELGESLQTSIEIQSNYTKLVLSDYKNTIQYWNYKFSTYITIFYVILSYISINEVSYHIAFASENRVFVYATIPLEILFLLKIIYVKFYTGYVDEAGDFVTDNRLIRLRYIKTVWFYLDLIALLPFELLVFALKKKDRVYGVSWFRITKFLRAFEIQRFFNKKTDTLSVNMLLMKNLMVIAWTSTLFHQCTCFCYSVICPRSHCSPTATLFKLKNAGYKNQYLNTMYYISVVLTTTGFGDITPKDVPEIFCVDILCLVGFFYTALFIGDVISTVRNHIWAKTNFKFQLTALKTYLHVNDIPTETQTAVVNYAQNIWRNENGQEVPELLSDAPSYLINEIKQSTYGHHINDNPVFGKCDYFCRRTLINNLTRKVFFFADVIVNEGEVNRTVYFVHSGLVESTSSDENFKGKLYKKNKFFGLRQGVLKTEPHTKTFIAKTTSIILTLQLSDWDFLSEFYPKDIERIIEATKDDQWE